MIEGQSVQNAGVCICGNIYEKSFSFFPRIDVVEDKKWTRRKGCCQNTRFSIQDEYTRSPACVPNIVMQVWTPARS